MANWTMKVVLEDDTTDEVAKTLFDAMSDLFQEVFNSGKVLGVIMVSKESGDEANNS